VKFWLIQTFNGISYGALLFLLGSGLSLIFGVMRIVNLSHGSYFLWGGYIALSVIWTTGSWGLSLPVAAFAVALIGLVMERVFLRPLGFDPLRQVLLTVGFAYLFQQGALDIWGGNNMEINPPSALTHSVVFGGMYFPLYRLFMITTALAIGDGEDAGWRHGPCDSGRRTNGAWYRHRYQSSLHVDFRARRAVGGARWRYWRCFPWRLSGP
jgi:branched-chain amino acid transport system permease protein